MCRRKIVQAYCLIAFGAGMLLGLWWNSWFWCGLGGAALIAVGISMLTKR